MAPRPGGVVPGEGASQPSSSRSNRGCGLGPGVIALTLLTAWRASFNFSTRLSVSHALVILDDDRSPFGGEDIAGIDAAQFPEPSEDLGIIARVPDSPDARGMARPDGLLDFLRGLGLTPEVAGGHRLVVGHQVGGLQERSLASGAASILDVERPRYVLRTGRVRLLVHGTSLRPHDKRHAATRRASTVVPCPATTRKSAAHTGFRRSISASSITADSLRACDLIGKEAATDGLCRIPSHEFRLSSGGETGTARSGGAGDGENDCSPGRLGRCRHDVSPLAAASPHDDTTGGLPVA